MERGAHWSEIEVRATVEDYFWMLERELRGERYSKTAQREALLAKLGSRAPGAVERKHQNISAILVEIGFPFIRGYKPLPNYQGLLRDIVLESMPSALSLLDAADALSSGLTTEPRTLSIQVEPPDMIVREKPREHQARAPRGVRTDFVERDHKNRALGLRGEELVLAHERQRLSAAGRSDLAARVRWTSQEDGDGAGFDIESYELQGQARLIEVKTTNHHDRFPFMVTRNELATSERSARDYQLVRVFDFSRNPRYFVLAGAIRDHVDLQATDYRASFIRDP